MTETAAPYTTAPSMIPTPQYIIDALCKTEFYCPACGDVGLVNTPVRFLIAPGSWHYTCPLCGTSFDVQVEYVEIESAPDASIS